MFSALYFYDMQFGYCITFFFSFLITFFLIPFFRFFAISIDALDRPDGKIKKHKKPVPYFGGIAVFLGFTATLILCMSWSYVWLWLFIGLFVLLVVGVIDDLCAIPPYKKFFGQIIATCCFLQAGLYAKATFLSSSFWLIPLSFFWILSVINAFNLVDVMDGLATTLALSSSISFLIIAFYLGQYNIIPPLGAFIGSLCAFFWYNKPPATIYLGDTGSLCIGGFLATIPFVFQWGEYSTYGYCASIIIMSIPLLELVALMVIRALKGIPFYYGSPDHFSFYLQSRGWSKEKILLFVFGCSLFCCFVALLFVLGKIGVISVGSIGILFLLCWYLLIYS